MSPKKYTGSFYTPPYIADFVVKRVAEKLDGRTLKILEPSAGDGVFIRALSRSDRIRFNVDKLFAVEISAAEAEKISAENDLNKLEVICNDFLEFQSELTDFDFNLVIGNPPYIKRNYLSDRQIELSAKIHASYPELSKNTVKNIWSAFLVRSIRLLADDGVLALVLPAELLQVKYAKELRELLLNQFQRVEVFTFNELLFHECKGQDTLILIAEKKSTAPGLFFCNVENLKDLGKSPSRLKLNHHKALDSLKWTSHTLTSSERRLLEQLAKNLPTINDVCFSRTGIVTAANNFFILNKAEIERLSLVKYAKPIIQKSSIVDASVVFCSKKLNALFETNTPCFLLDLNEKGVEENRILQDYLFEGTSRQIHLRYKMLSRKLWFQVPNIGTPAPALFFKRCHDYPKFIKNEATALATDSAYLVNSRDGFDINSIIHSFYNSLTLAFAELNGRYYGGGVLELTPSEFKGLPIPYVSITNSQFSKFALNFDNKDSIEKICLKYDEFILKHSFPNITYEQIEQLRRIRNKLSIRRHRL
ncbi:N-6 DNA methylase [Methylobacter sp. G7]|uniref:Eco57I restriction-modification methylase domain-containing protein n=1 Tax=Methylobacter sp. G7 TaxID=3230117 RepID=UPI003D806DC6